jgi:uncharacterized protein involved in response to NO
LTFGLARVPFLSQGFRPFFLAGAFWAGTAMILWIGELAGFWRFAESYGPIAWHAHELLFGYVSAVVGGFLLTAIPNWTGRLPVRGGPLLGLFVLWMAGRVALLIVDWIGLAAAATIDAAFLVVFAMVILREIIAGRNWRNLKTVVLVSVLAAGNIVFHVEVIASGAPDISVRIGVSVIVGLIMLIGGRIIPSFTRNWLAKQGSPRRPASFGRFDELTLAASGFALLLWVAAPAAWDAGVAFAAAAIIQVGRLARWSGAATWREPLVFVLHLGYAFVPAGFGTVAASILLPDLVPGQDALHAWTVGAVGVMTLAVMTRASLGHTGRELVATGTTRLIYVAIVSAALFRLAAPLSTGAIATLLSLAGLSWIAGFGTFVVAYAPMLVRQRQASSGS